MLKLAGKKVRSVSARFQILTKKKNVKYLLTKTNPSTTVRIYQRIAEKNTFLRNHCITNLPCQERQENLVLKNVKRILWPVRSYTQTMRRREDQQWFQEVQKQEYCLIEQNLLRFVRDEIIKQLILFIILLIKI